MTDQCLRIQSGEFPRMRPLARLMSHTGTLMIKAPYGRKEHAQHSETFPVFGDFRENVPIVCPRGRLTQ